MPGTLCGDCCSACLHIATSVQSETNLKHTPAHAHNTHRTLTHTHMQLHSQHTQTHLGIAATHAAKNINRSTSPTSPPRLPQLVSHPSSFIYHFILSYCIYVYIESEVLRTQSSGLCRLVPTNCSHILHSLPFDLVDNLDKSRVSS